MTVYVVIYEIRNGGNGPIVFKSKDSALEFITKDFADCEDFTNKSLEKLINEDYCTFGWNDENSISIHQEKVNE